MVIFLVAVVAVLAVGYYLGSRGRNAAPTGNDGLVDSLREQIAALDGKLKDKDSVVARMTEQIRDLTSERDVQRAKADNYMQNISAQRDGYEKQIEELKRSSAKQAEELRDSYARQLAQVKENADRQIEALRAMNREQLESQLKLIKEQMQTTSEEVLKRRQ